MLTGKLAIIPSIVPAYISRISVYMYIREGVISFLITYSERYLDQYSSEARVRHGTFRGNVTALDRVEA